MGVAAAPLVVADTGPAEGAGAALVAGASVEAGAAPEAEAAAEAVWAAAAAIAEDSTAAWAGGRGTYLWPIPPQAMRVPELPLNLARGLSPLPRSSGSAWT